MKAALAEWAASTSDNVARRSVHDDELAAPSAKRVTPAFEAGANLAKGKIVEARDATRLLEAVVRPGDRVCLEGDNQKQADMLCAALLAVDPAKVNDLHMVQSGDRAAGTSRPVRPRRGEEAGLCLFRPAIGAHRDHVVWRQDRARRGPYLSRVVCPLLSSTSRRNVALIAAVSADREGNLYTGPNTEDTPTVVEATAFKDGIVIAQVNEIVDKVPRVDIPGDRVHFVVKADKPFFVEPLFTRDPAAITETQILTAMLAIKGIYAPYGVRAAQPRDRLQHRRDRTAAADIWREAGTEGQGREPFRLESRTPP